VKLDRIYFIQHGAVNSARRIAGAAPVQHLLNCSFPPYWDSEGMEFTMDIFSDLTAAVPCYELFFKPDTGVIDYINSLPIEPPVMVNGIEEKLLAQDSSAGRVAHGA
jgi:hypothetical protein